jgi:hypothetical protein
VFHEGLTLAKISKRLIDRILFYFPPKIFGGKIRPPISPQRLEAQPAASNPSTGPSNASNTLICEILSLTEVVEIGFEIRNFRTFIPEVGVVRSTSGRFRTKEDRETNVPTKFQENRITASRSNRRRKIFLPIPSAVGSWKFNSRPIPIWPPRSHVIWIPMTFSDSQGSIYPLTLSLFRRYRSSFVPRSWETAYVEAFRGEKND